MLSILADDHDHVMLRALRKRNLSGQPFPSLFTVSVFTHTKPLPPSCRGV